MLNYFIFINELPLPADIRRLIGRESLMATGALVLSNMINRIQTDSVNIKLAMPVRDEKVVRAYCKQYSLIISDEMASSAICKFCLGKRCSVCGGLGYVPMAYFKIWL